MVKISPIEPEDTPFLARMYAKAFNYQGNAYPALFPEEYSANDASYQLESALIWLFEGRVSIWLQISKPIGLKAVNEQGDILGACWACPDAMQTPFSCMIRNGILRWPFRHGWSSFRAAMETEDLLPHESGTWELSMMAVTPEAQGKGVGTSIVKALIAAVHQVEPNAQLSLNTQREINVKFYSQFGFQLVSDKFVKGTYMRGFHNWHMTTVK
jgi:GNAT superfamily N-acetyltransferase